MIRCPWLGSRPVVSVSRTICRIVLSYSCASAGCHATTAGRQHGVDGIVGEPVGQLVLAVPAMAPDPVPGDLVAAGRRLQPPPEFLVLDRLLVGGAPATSLPVRQPLGDALADILGIGGELDPARPLQALQCPDGRHQLHAVVGGLRLGTGQGLLPALVPQQRAPATGAGIAAAGAITEYLDAGQHPKVSRSE